MVPGFSTRSKLVLKGLADRLRKSTTKSSTLRGQNLIHTANRRLDIVSFTRRGKLFEPLMDSAMEAVAYRMVSGRRSRSGKRNGAVLLRFRLRRCFIFAQPSAFCPETPGNLHTVLLSKKL